MVCEDTLKIKNLPKELSNAEKEDLLRHFGASEIKIITSRAKQKSVVFAKFSSKEIAKNVMHRLHQLAILNSRLTVEFAEHDLGKNHQTGNLKLQEPIAQNPKKYLQSFINKLNAFNNSVHFYQPPPSHLKYVYPKPNRATINNIAHALASIPKFYTQVLHLMNRMNLPPPFSDVPDPPQMRQPIFQQTSLLRSESTITEQAKKDESSESEIESDPESSSTHKEVIPEKRKLPQKKTLKRPKFIKPNTAAAMTVNRSTERTEDVFEKTELHLRKIELKLNSENLEMQLSRSDNVMVTDITPNQNDSGTSEIENPVISEAELNANRIPAKELGILPVFKNYHCGAPSSRLYVKNIAKNVDEKDLEYIYKRYSIEDPTKEKNVFDIRLMQEGRMKGQAFITLDSVQTAQKALKETNGFILKDKPLVVVYARSVTTSSKNK